MKKLLLAFLLFCSGCIGTAQAMTTEMPDEGIDRVVAATAALTNDKGHAYCAGSFIHGHILTAAHCAEADILNYAVIADWSEADGKFTHLYLAQVVAKDTIQDYAILEFVGVSPMHGELLLSPTDPFRGQKVVAVGHPLGELVFTVTEGVVSYPLREDYVRDPNVLTRWIQTSVPIWYGNSGGPLVNLYGEQLGIASFMFSNVPHLNGFVHTSTIRTALAALH